MRDPVIIERATVADMRELVEQHHGYGSMGNTATYVFVVKEGGRVVAAYSWQPPPVGAAKSVCPEAPSAVLALSRMVAVPKAERHLKHVSKPLRVQMKRLIDRGRWPVLVTFSDEGQGHNGYVYQCSGWTPTLRARRETFTDASGARVSPYANGKMRRDALTKGPLTWLQRWEHWACEQGGAAAHMMKAGWVHEPIPGRKWKSGSPAFRWVNRQVTRSSNPHP
jgi:hypothetical protein